VNNFKVGDRVVRTHNPTDRVTSPDFVEGKVYTVTEVSLSGRWINVDHPFNGKRDDRYPFWANYFRLAKYSEYFTERKVAKPTTGHAADSPIQKHSKGEIYPLCVVGYSDIGRTAFTIENLETGEVLGFMPGESKGSSNIRAWSSAHGAYNFLAGSKEGMKASKWIKGRPTFIKHSFGLEIVVPPKHKRWAVVLDKVDLNKDTMLLNGVYYQSLEQDIG